LWNIGRPGRRPPPIESAIFRSPIFRSLGFTRKNKKAAATIAAAFEVTRINPDAPG
jgi:hypothetical protein